MTQAPRSGHAGRVISVGRLYCDLIFTGLPKMPTLGEEVFAGGLSLTPGGGAFITAAYVAALGRPVSLASALPSGLFAEALMPELTASGVDLSASQPTSAALDPQITVAMASGVERAFLTRRSGPAVPPGFAAALATGRFAHLHIGELATLVEEPSLVPLARAAGMTVSLDCSWDDAVLARDDLAALIASVDIFLPNETEADRLGISSSAPPPAPLTVVKRGAHGSVALSAEGAVFVKARPVEVIDSTGAGDAFNAGFIDAWLSGLPVERCLRAGNRCGAEAVTRIGGATELPDLAALLAKRA
ncbi:carbohydrate kinase family protein [Nitratireductor pacificus]|uniref:PfkB domain-containing protein n=1 Tax=Nitratireductor pacificus pht-3B TaxID=391937 RepID=K2MBV8_9HYPH|nr:carbohydrate kinase family protein [Nitratireductor pacificus]EKF19606.1 PfkB domain-containing protein [Nitratireductor pacificus pht-3B]